MYLFQAYGLTIRSPLFLPELVPITEIKEKKIDVIIRFDKINFFFKKSNNKRVIRLTDEGIYLFWNNIGSFLVCNGREIIVEPCPNVEESTLRTFILGTTLAMLLHQRCELSVLHASAVSLSDQTMAFVGFKGAGKSTIAAALHAHGYDLLADDILAIASKQNKLFALPGFPHIKLWPDSLTALDHVPDSLPRLRPELEKRGYRIQSGFTQVPTPLRGIFVLGQGHDLTVKSLSPREALTALIPHWYGARFGMDLLRNLGLPNLFFQCAEIVSKIPVYCLQRPDDLSTLPDVVQFIESSINHDLQSVS